MESWYTKDCVDAIEQKELLLELEAHVPSLRAAAQRGAPAYAVFTRNDQATGHLTFYFPPPAAPLARTMGATPCAKPEAAGLRTVRVAHHTSLTFYFPGWRTNKKRPTGRSQTGRVK